MPRSHPRSPKQPLLIYPWGKSMPDLYITNSDEARLEEQDATATYMRQALAPLARSIEEEQG